MGSLFARIEDYEEPKKGSIDWAKIEDKPEMSLSDISDELRDKDGGYYLNDVRDGDMKMALKSAMKINECAGSISYEVMNGTLEHMAIDEHQVKEDLGEMLVHMVRLAQSLGMDLDDIVNEALRAA